MLTETQKRYMAENALDFLIPEWRNAPPQVKHMYLDKLKEVVESGYNDAPQSTISRIRVKVLERALERIGFENVGVEQVAPIARNALLDDATYGYVPS